PMFETVARAAAEQPPVRMFGMAVEQKMRVGRQVVLAHTEADQRRAREGGKPSRHVAARQRLTLGIGEPLELVGIDLGSRHVIGALETKTTELAVPVKRPVVVAEARGSR